MLGAWVLDMDLGDGGDAIHLEFVEVVTDMFFSCLERVKCIGVDVSKSIWERFVVLEKSALVVFQNISTATILVQIYWMRRTYVAQKIVQSKVAK